MFDGGVSSLPFLRLLFAPIVTSFNLLRVLQLFPRDVVRSFFVSVRLLPFCSGNQNVYSLCSRDPKNTVCARRIFTRIGSSFCETNFGVHRCQVPLDPEEANYDRAIVIIRAILSLEKTQGDICNKRG